MRDEGIKLMVSLNGVGEQHDAQRPTVNGGPSFRFSEQTISTADPPRPPRRTCRSP